MKQLFRCMPCSSVATFLVVGLFVVGSLLAGGFAAADVARGSREDAQSYYRAIAAKLGFSTPDKIFTTTLTDVATYLGYPDLTGADLQNVPSDALVSAGQGDILASRFFAPKITNIRDPEETRQIGWRKLVRLRARLGSVANAHGIAAGIVLFNFFANPGATPFAPTDESVNTQVMLIPELSKIPAPRDSDADIDALYWLDYDRLSRGGMLAFALAASFDANELPADSGGVQSYFVPDGCVACHGNNAQRSMVNYLDTDHWFDRLDNDFTKLKAQGLSILFDAGTNDTNAIEYKKAFDAIRRFNLEAELQGLKAQPRHDEVLAGKKWLEIHAFSDEHLPPTARAIGPEPQWSSTDPNDAKLLADLNQYCFRCHGTVKFSVFNKSAVQERHPNIIERIKTDASIGVRMPPDRDLPDDVRRFLNDNLP